MKELEKRRLEETEYKKQQLEKKNSEKSWKISVRR